MDEQQKTHRDKLDPLREEKLNSIGFPFHEQEKAQATSRCKQQQ